MTFHARTLAAALALMPAGAMPHSAHEHGIGELLVAVENATVAIELRSPAVNLLGFEHRPRSPEQWQQARQAMTAVGGETLIRIDDADGSCEQKNVEWSTALFDAAALAAAEAASPGAAAGDPDEAHHHHDHGDSEDSGGHADITVSYTFVCSASPMAFDHDLFETFPGLEQLRVSIVTGDGQAGHRQRRGDSSRLDL